MSARAASHPGGMRATDPHPDEQQELQSEHRERLARRRHHREDEDEGHHDLHVGGQAVDHRVAGPVERVGVTGTHRYSTRLGVSSSTTAVAGPRTGPRPR